MQIQTARLHAETLENNRLRRSMGPGTVPSVGAAIAAEVRPVTPGDERVELLKAALSALKQNVCVAILSTTFVKTSTTTTDSQS
jgi:hypothetical protein